MSMRPLSRAVRKLLRATRVTRPLAPEVMGQEANDLIRRFIESPNSCMIARFGGNELDAILTFFAASKPRLSERLKIVMRGGSLGWNEDIRRAMNVGAGFFPPDDASLEKFCRRMLVDAKEIDVLGSWLPGERIVHSEFSRARIIRLKDLEPYYHQDPWSEALKDRTVLVVSPFATSIQKQYSEKRDLLFQDRRILPDFSLKTLSAVQSIGEVGGNKRFHTWFDALEWMCNEISRTEFDVAIIGAGAYGLPLAAHVKRQGRKALHLGGACQILFGIRGKRWDNNSFFQNLYNQHWIRPSAEETPANASKVEGGCYW